MTIMTSSSSNIFRRRLFDFFKWQYEFYDKIWILFATEELEQIFYLCFHIIDIFSP